MDIAWYGHAAFRLRGRDIAIVLDPCPSSTGFRLGRPQAEIVTISNPAPEHAWHQGVGGVAMCLDVPGEYEIQNVLLTGVVTNPPPVEAAPDGAPADGAPTDGAPAAGALADGPRLEGEPQAARNVAFVVTIDDIVVAHLGDLRAEPCSEALEELSRADILLVPVGGQGHLDAKTAAKVAASIDARLVIPMLYKVGPETAALDGVDPFLNAMGVSSSAAGAPAERENHINVTRATLGEHTAVHALAPRGD